MNTTTETTVEPIAAATVQDAEFLDCVGVREKFGIKRSLLYELALKDRKIKSVSLRRRGQVRGKRLFDVASIRKFLREQMENGQ